MAETNKNIMKGLATKERILEQAFKLFMSMPYELVTVSQIEKEIHVTRGAIFHHLKGKHELFEEVIENYFINTQNIYYALGEDILEKDITLEEFINIFISSLEKRFNALYAFLGIDRKDADKSILAKANCSYLTLLTNTGYYLDKYNEKMDSNFRMHQNTWSFFIQKSIEKGEVKPNTNVKLFGMIFTSIYMGKSLFDAFSEGVNEKEIKELLIEIYNRIKA